MIELNCQKAWFIEDNIRKLMKGTYTSSKEEPINEYIASVICERLLIPHVDYQIRIYNNRLVSVCPNILNSHEEIISAYDIFTSHKSDLLKYIDLSSYDLDKLKDIPDILPKTLYQYIRYIEMSEERIEKVIREIKYRIEFLIELSK